jgi:hypothetical protein
MLENWIVERAGTSFIPSCISGKFPASRLSIEESIAGLDIGNPIIINGSRFPHTC